MGKVRITGSAPVTKDVISAKNIKLRNRRITHMFYIASMVYMTVLVFVGFWPTYFGQLFSGLPVRNWVIHVHAAVFTGWLFLILIQVGLVASGNTKYHRKLGKAGGFYGLLILLLGLAVAIVFPLQNIESGLWTVEEAASFIIFPLGDVLIFSGFFAAALWYRNSIETHKRLMLTASVMLVFPAAARIFGEDQVPALLLFWLLPILGGILLDGILQRKVHSALMIGLAVLLISAGRVAVWETETWVNFARSLLSLFM